MNKLLERAEKVPSTSAGKHNEKKRVVNGFMNNNYPLRLIKSCDCHRKANHRVSNSNTSDEVETSFVVLSYVKGVTERVSRVLRNKEVKWHSR